MMRWNPSRYGQYASERSTPFFDLIAHLDAAAPRRVVDLGCGPGTLTAILAERWPDAEVVGVDSSREMLEAARELPDPPANLSFQQLDINDWAPGPADDVVVTNAALQWVPNHVELIERWLPQLPDGAWFAMQVPGNFRSRSHSIMREVAESDTWHARLSAVLRPVDVVAEPDDYLTQLLDADFAATAWETTYLHVLHGDDPVLDWVRGTWLRPILGALNTDESAAFEAELGERLRTAYPAGRHGTVYPFRRLFAVGVKGSR
jgi:trans-aconitate 2-methyltransferase